MTSSRILRLLAKNVGIAVAETPNFELLQELPEHIRAELISLYRGEPQLTRNGDLSELNNSARVSITQGLWLHQLCLENQLTKTLEVGLAYGFSALYLLALLEKMPSNRHTAIDPYELQVWKGIGLAKAEAAVSKFGMDPCKTLEFIEERSDRAAIDLGRAGRRFDLVFIDGSHTFDAAFVDFCLYDPLCREGGFLVFDDMWMSSIRSVASFVSTNRQDYRRVRNAHPNVAAFQKIGQDTRAWDHFVSFKVSPRTPTERARSVLSKLR